MTIGTAIVTSVGILCATFIIVCIIGVRLQKNRK